MDLDDSRRAAIAGADRYVDRKHPLEPPRLRDFIVDALTAGR